MAIIPKDIKIFLDEKARQYCHPKFIETDPIQIPASFEEKENKEIAGFLSATIAWGQRPTIIQNAWKLMHLMDNDPYSFLIHSTENDWRLFSNFKHRTFNGTDCIYFLKALQNIYRNHGGLEQVFSSGYLRYQTIFGALSEFRKIFFENEDPSRTGKHVSNVEKGASAKRLNMFLRWMVRNNSEGVDFGLWKKIPASALMLPLDVHTGNVARKLNLLHRKQNDWRAVEEVTENLRSLNPKDPVYYDFALFGLGIFEGF